MSGTACAACGTGSDNKGYPGHVVYLDRVSSRKSDTTPERAEQPLFLPCSDSLMRVLDPKRAKIPLLSPKVACLSRLSGRENDLLIDCRNRNYNVSLEGDHSGLLTPSDYSVSSNDIAPALFGIEPFSLQNRTALHIAIAPSYFSRCPRKIKGMAGLEPALSGSARRFQHDAALLVLSKFAPHSLVACFLFTRMLCKMGFLDRHRHQCGVG